MHEREVFLTPFGRTRVRPSFALRHVVTEAHRVRRRLPGWLVLVLTALVAFVVGYFVGAR